MADEDTKAKEPTPEEQAAQYREALIAQGYSVFAPQDMHGFKTSVTDPLKAQIAERDAELSRIRAEHESLAREKAERDNAGKSRAELLEAQLKASHDALKAREAEIEGERAQRAALQDRYRSERRDALLQTILSDPSAPQAVDAEAALLKAKANLGSLAVNDAGELEWTEPNGIQHTGPAAAKIVREWWSMQTGLHRSGPAGPPTNGAAKAPAPKTVKYESNWDEPLDVRLAKARAFKAQQS